MSSIKRSAPILATAFVNKCGSIGLSLFAMVLVERKVSSSDSSLLLSLVQLTGLLGLVLGGIIADLIGFRRVMLGALALMALGFFGIPLAQSVSMLGLAAALAQFGTVFYQSSVRMVLVGVVEPGEKQEALGWLKTGNNLGQVFSYSLGAVFWQAGTSFLMYLDAGTSVIALIVGLFFLPQEATSSPEKEKASVLATDPANTAIDPPSMAHWRLFAFVVVLLAGFCFLEEVFMIGSSALFKVRFGSEGLHVFSVMMAVNTVICTLLAIPAARLFKGTVAAFYFGLIFFAVGSIVVIASTDSHLAIYIGMAILTLGELAFTTMGQFVAVEVLPQVKSQGALYGASLMVQTLGKTAAAAAAFPLIVNGQHPVAVVALTAGVLLAWLVALHSSLVRHLAEKIIAPPSNSERQTGS